MTDILCGTENDVLTITFDRPEALNAVDADMLTAAAHAIEQTHARVVVLSGQGRAFSSGADLRGLDTGIDPGTDTGIDPGIDTGSIQAAGNRLVTAIIATQRPVVARVNGPAVGIGMSIALASDICIAAESAYFLQAFINIGLMPDGGATELVSACIGRARAKRMALLREKMPARQAAELGLIGEVVADDALDADVNALVARLAAGPTRAYASTKAAIDRNSLSRFHATLDSELASQRELADTADAREGISAFLEKREARFTAS